MRAYSTHITSNDPCFLRTPVARCLRRCCLLHCDLCESSENTSCAGRRIKNVVHRLCGNHLSQNRVNKRLMVNVLLPVAERRIKSSPAGTHAGSGKLLRAGKMYRGLNFVRITFTCASITVYRTERSGALQSSKFRREMIRQAKMCG